MMQYFFQITTPPPFSLPFFTPLPLSSNSVSLGSRNSVQELSSGASKVTVTRAFLKFSVFRRHVVYAT